MTKPLICSLIAIAAMLPLSAHAQGPAEAVPQFTIGISEYRHDSRGPGVHRIRVIETNISNRDLHLEGCAQSRGLFRFSVAFNGVRLAEKDDAAQRNLQEKMRKTSCTSSSINDVLKPGASYAEIVTVPHTYDMSRSGTYEIIVSRDASSDPAETGATIKSNTITIVVPEPEASAPK
jgi:hypothetical protein